jgi:siroheme synthase
MAASQIGSPSIIVIGDVVRFAEKNDLNNFTAVCA